MRLRTRIMMIVVGGAIVPLALIGVYLTASGSRAGRDLLRDELTASLSNVAAHMATRWSQRSAELALLTNNEPVQRMLGGAGDDLAATGYLQDVSRALRLSIRDFTVRDATGRVRWSTPSEPAAERDAPLVQRQLAGFTARDAFTVRRPVLGSGGRRLGDVEAHVYLSALLPTDSLQLLVSGATLRIRNRENGESIGRPAALDSAASVVTVKSAMAEPPLDLEVTSPDARYVRPFARAGRAGLAFLMAVAVLALILTAFLTRRLTGALEQMVEATGAVAAGDLARTVEGSGDDEVGRLGAAFNTMTESLRRTLHELSRREALAAVGEFAAAISHETRNALTSVRLDLQRLAERAAVADDRALVRRMLSNVRRLDSIVTGSLRIARADPSTMRSISLEGVVRSAISATEQVFAESGNRVVLEPVADEGLRVRGDSAALEQMFINLLMNAAQSMSGGGLARVEVEVRENRLAVRIADQGRGIPPEMLARLGERFFSSRVDGTGLGFAIARQIAGVHGGDVSVTSTSASGTIVEVVLPRSDYLNRAFSTIALPPSRASR